MKKMVMRSVIVVFLLGGLTSAFLNVYYIMDRANGDLLWRNGDKAYVFIHVGSIGYRLTYLHYLGYLLVGYFGVAPPATSESSSVIVVEISENGVQHYEVKPLSLNVFTPVDESIYSASEGVVYKWSGTQFERASPQEVQRFKSNSLTAPDFTNIDGWSKRCCLLARAAEVKFEVQISGKPITISVKQGDRDSNISIDISRPDQPPERIWYLDQRSRRVSRPEYEQVFGKY